MIYFYVDESGSMTTDYSANNPFFVIAIVRSNDNEALKRKYKRFVRTHFQELKDTDERSKSPRMFHEGKFVELKGSHFTPNLKISFLEHFCRDNLLEVYYIIIDNTAVKPHFFNNTARAFNFVFKNNLVSLRKRNIIPDDDLCIQLDERNERTETKFFLENYLKTEFCDHALFSHNITVSYFDSACNKIIQIADVFANIMYSELRTNAYSDYIDDIRHNGYLKFTFDFPPN